MKVIWSLFFTPFDLCTYFMHIHSVALNAIGWPVEDWFSPAFGKRSWHRTRDSPQELVWDFPPRKNRASQTQTPLKRGETSWLWESLTASSRSSTISFPDKRWRSSTRSPQWMEKQELPMKCAGLAACCCYDPGMMSHILQRETSLFHTFSLGVSHTMSYIIHQSLHCHHASLPPWVCI